MRGRRFQGIQPPFIEGQVGEMILHDRGTIFEVEFWQIINKVSSEIFKKDIELLTDIMRSY